MSQKLPNAVSSSEPFYQDTYSRRHGPPKSKAVRDTAKTLRSERSRDPGSKGDSLNKKENIVEHGVSDFYIKTKPKVNLPSKSLISSPNMHLVTDGGHGETWGKILRAQSSNENNLGFSKFDPLRTIHFLGKELQSQLRDSIPHNSTVFDVINEMQSAIKRIPHDIQLIADTAAKKHEGRLSKLRNHSKVERTKMRTEGCQTPNMWYLEPIRLQQHLEESSEKIEKACQQMEALCSKLKTEKENLEVQLQIEKENSKLLEHQAEEYKVKIQGISVVLESLKNQNNTLKAEVEKQRAQLATIETPSAAELKLFIQDLERTRTSAELENNRLREQVRLAQIETGKYETMLQARDLQVKEIRDEMTQLQEVVNEQLLDFQNLSTSEEASYSQSVRTVVHDQASMNEGGRLFAKQESEQNSGTMVSLQSETVQELFNNNPNQYGDAHSTGGSTQRAEVNHSAEINELHLQADNVKLRHVCKLPVANVIESVSLREQFFQAKLQLNEKRATGK